MKTRPSTVALLVAAASTGACRRHPATPPPSPQNAPAPTVMGPNGTTPTTPESPPGQQVQITNVGGGQSSVVSVPPTPATGCPAQLANGALGPGTVHSATVNQNETWTAEGSPHRLPNGINVAAGATLTIAPCAVLLVDRDEAISADADGAIVAVGEANRPIRFSSSTPEPQPGAWKAVYFDEHARPSSRLANVTIEYAGGESGESVRSGLVVKMAGLDAQAVTIQRVVGYGVELTGSGSFAPTASDLRVSGVVATGVDQSGSVYTDSADSVGTLPQRSTLTGNAINEVFLSGGAATVRTAQTWRNLGVRYHVADGVELRVEGPTSPTLTVAPGTTLAFGAGSSLAVGWDAQGGLVADGQSDATRITFTAAASEAQPGAWKGLLFGEHFLRAATRVSFATISFAGADTSLSLCDWTGDNSDDAAVFIQAQPSTAFLSHVQFTNLPPNAAAIARNWSGTAVDFAAASLGNDFARAGAPCRQSPVQSAAGGCPDNARCN